MLIRLKLWQKWLRVSRNTQCYANLKSGEKVEKMFTPKKL
jgi:hypothetical protein